MQVHPRTRGGQHWGKGWGRVEAQDRLTNCELPAIRRELRTFQEAQSTLS